MQPYLCVNFIISLFGIFPTPDLEEQHMADPFVAEIRIFPFNFAPKGWAFCDGQLMPISQNTALFSLLGTTYGGDGKSTFALPDLQGSAPMHPGQGPGLSLHDLGETGGQRDRNAARSPRCRPTTTCCSASTYGCRPTATPDNPTAAIRTSVNGNAYADGAVVQMPPRRCRRPAASQPHNNMQPYLTLNFCIALQGVFPPRS